VLWEVAVQAKKIGWEKLTIVDLDNIAHLHFAPDPLYLDPLSGCTASQFDR
jgi:hypothetical protein